MNLTINGEPRDYAASTVAELMVQLEIDASRVAIELNQEILPKAYYGTTQLKDDDTLEIVQFVGGG
jgi:sulfur carrier protein